MKKFTPVFIIAFTFFLEKSIAQFNLEWHTDYQHTTANNFSNESRKVVADPSGNSYVLADVTSNKDPGGIVTTSTWHYTVLNKYSSTGALLFSQSVKVFNHVINGFDNLGAFGMEIDASNNIYIGYSPYDPVKNFDVAIAKYNSNLVLQWVRTYNPASVDNGVDMGIVGGNVYAIVRSSSGGNITYRIIKASGNTINDTALYSFTANTDVLNAIKVQTGIIYVTGYRMISGYKNVLTVKLNNAGSLKWENTFNGNLAGDDYGKDITIGGDGNIYVAGSSWRASPHNFDMLLMKIGPGGANLWNRYRDHAGANDVGMFVEAPGVDFAYVGTTAGNSFVLNQLGLLTGTNGGQAFYSPVPIASYVSLNGIELNDFKVSTNNGFYFCGSLFATDAQGRLYSAQCLAKFKFPVPTQRDAFILDSTMPVEGDYNNSLSGASMALNYYNADILWLTDKVSNNGNHNQETVRIMDFSMISPIRKANAIDNFSAAGEVSIAPNPSADEISFNSNEKIKKIELFDLTGKIVQSVSPGYEKTTMDISGLMNGIYIGKIYTASGTVTSKKIIKN
jgi:hypothetical protein